MELGAKSAKRLIRENMALNGGIDNDSFRRVRLYHRNTPDKVLLDRPVKDFLPILSYSYKPREECNMTIVWQHY